MAGVDVLRDVEQHTIAKLARVIQAKNGHLRLVCAAEILENALATDTTHGVFTGGIQCVFLPGASASDRREPVNVSCREDCDSAFAIAIGNESWQIRIGCPSQPLLTGATKFHSCHEDDVGGIGKFGERSGIEQVATSGF